MLNAATAGLIGVILGSTISGVIAIYTTKRQQEAENQRVKLRQSEENKRKHAEFFMDKKVESLISAHENLQLYHRILTDFAASIEEDQDIDDLYFENGRNIHFYESAESIRRVGVFLEQQQQQMLYDFLDQCLRVHSLAIDYTGDEEEFDHSEFNREFEKLQLEYGKAIKKLENIMREPIDRFENSR